MLLRTTALVLLVLPFAIACGAEEAVPEETGATQSEVVRAVGSSMQTTARVNLREGASTTDEIILTMPKGAIVKTLAGATTNGFFKVSYQGDEGWAHSTYLTPADSAAPAADDEQAEEAPKPAAGFNGKSFSDVTMLWEGDYAFLDKCDPPYGATFSCDGAPSRSFVDNGAWIAVPHVSFSKALCKKSARVCKGAKCITAQVMDRGATGSFEGSTSVLKALGVTPGAKGCSSFGTTNGVTVTLE